jgi:hypothetical protein
MPSPLLVHDDAEPLVAFLLWCLAMRRAEQERKRKMHGVLVRVAGAAISQAALAISRSSDGLSSAGLRGASSATAFAPMQGDYRVESSHVVRSGCVSVSIVSPTKSHPTAVWVDNLARRLWLVLRNAAIFGSLTLA